MKTKVSNMTSNRSGREVANQFEIRTKEGIYFQSYNSIIVFIPNDWKEKTQIGQDWDYSTTTGKYRNQFLGETKKETQAKIDNGTYILNYDL